MSTAAAIGRLRALGSPAVETREAASVLGLTTSGAGKMLKRAEQAGLVRHLRRGLWAVDQELSRAALSPYLTAPFPAYASLWSALARHEMIEQIPSEFHVASLARSQRIDTAVGTFSVHHIAPELFTGFEPSADGPWATPEKALFDTVYHRAPRGGGIRLPEISLPASFDCTLLERWLEMIPARRMRTIVQRGLQYTLEQARAAG